MKWTRYSSHDCRLALGAAKLMREHIAELSGDDPEFIWDTLASEADFEGIVRILLGSMGVDEAHLDGLKAYIDDLKARRDRLGRRVEAKPTVETDIATMELQPKAAQARPPDVLKPVREH